MQTKTPLILSVLILVVSVVLLVVPSFRTPGITTGSIVTGQEYYSTTTRQNFFPALYLLKTGPGSFARVTITGVQTGVINLYDATTSNVLLRTGNKATSSITLANFPASLAVGTYDFDLTFNDGLLIETTGIVPTSTLMWR